MKRDFQSTFLATATMLLLVSGCATIPDDYPKTESFAITDTANTQLGLDVAAWNAENEGVSGFYPLQSGTDALAARLRLIEAAEKSLDVQYFLMKDDVAGHVFSESLLQAADRGVRIRFLLDDIFSTVTDEELFILDRHENIEVRLYNPTARRGVYILNFIGDFERANRRMHNKSLTADNVVSIIGGRNIADEYFDLSEEIEFTDFDVFGVGDVAPAVAQAFDRSWNSTRALPLEALDVRFTDEELDTVRQQMADKYAQVDQTVHADAMTNELVSHLFAGEVALYPAKWELLVDDPSKLETSVHEDAQDLVNRLSEVGLQAKSEIIVLSPYFVPLQAGLDYWESITSKGVRVVLVTNSMASTNHLAVHSAYAKYRKALLEMGIELFETRVDDSGPYTVTLHTKGVVIDRERIFVGSLNLDPRSIDLNSEIGVVIESPQLSRLLAEDVMDDIETWAYRVTLDDNGDLQWQTSVDGETVIEDEEPRSTGWMRFKAWMLKIVPDSQL